ncbi:hypothetical protein [Rhizobium leguminosarum]|uniref:hypothetical protein n=1 Tax=Rhizobium leguminosarum TaxID=384 RepID=UPI003F9D312D
MATSITGFSLRNGYRMIIGNPINRFPTNDTNRSRREERYEYKHGNYRKATEGRCFKRTVLNREGIRGVFHARAPLLKKEIVLAAAAAH